MAKKGDNLPRTEENTFAFSVNMAHLMFQIGGKTGIASPFVDEGPAMGLL